MLCSTAKSISNEENNLARLRQNIDKTLQEEASPNNSLESIMTPSGQSGLESPTELGQNQTVTPLISSPNSTSAISRVASESRQNIDDSFLYPYDTWCGEKMLDRGADPPRTEAAVASGPRPAVWRLHAPVSH